MTEKVHGYMWLQTVSIKSTVGNKTTLFPSPFHVSNSSRVTLARAYHYDYVVACSTPLRSAAEKNNSGGYVTVPCPSNVTQHSTTEDWQNFWWRHQIGYDGTHAEWIFTFKVTLCCNGYNHHWKLFDTVDLDTNYCTSQFKRWIFLVFS